MGGSQPSLQGPGQGAGGGGGGESVFSLSFPNVLTSAFFCWGCPLPLLVVLCLSSPLRHSQICLSHQICSLSLLPPRPPPPLFCPVLLGFLCPRMDLDALGLTRVSRPSRL